MEMVTVELNRVQLEAFLREYGDPPDECDHGFTPPADCPNEECDDRDAVIVWSALRAALQPEQSDA